MIATAEHETQTQIRVLATGGDPHLLYDVPDEGEFEREIDPDPNTPDFDPDADDEIELLDYIPAEDLERYGKALIRQREEFEPIRNLTIVYLWRRQGGVEDGRPCLGGLKRPQGLERQLTEHLDEHGRIADFVLWLAADNLRYRILPAWKLEAIVYHQLCHAGIHPKTGSPRIKPHQFAGFAAEVEAYGLWSSELELAGKAIEQLPLFGDEVG